MLLSEAQWLQKNIEKYLSTESAPVLNLGISTLEFRTKTQPFIDALVIREIEKKSGSKIINSDLKVGDGIDLAGDIYDESFQKKISFLKCKTIVCTSFLEQVKDPIKAVSIIS
ncbi:MAG: hypothetical protein EXS48_01210 [Candidatus Staskawiczbacteria bacterium]|nr:hypothetical protein [Candidatus Staskawiczbacteria bacterium]